VPPLSPSQLREFTYNQTRKCEAGHLHIWLLSAVMNAEERDIYESVLSDDERARSSRYVFEIDRMRSITARGGLRWLLSSYCGVPPDSLRFQQGDYGKPSLHGASIHYEFNVSHSGDYVLIGITTGVHCGVDIEKSRARISEQSIAERFFCPREIQWLRQTEKGFLRLWTLKEAILKAVGHGMSIPLSDVDVTDIVEGRASTIVLETSGLAPQPMWLQELQLLDDYASAVAVAGEPREIHLMPEG
jgi:4'-phosphopantetheinyl transferase